MPRRQCHHCKEWIDADEPHDCWSTTVEVATEDLADDLREAWDRLHETAVDFGEQRVYASHKSIMFARDHCYFFVRPKRSFLEVVFFLGRTLKAPQVRRADRRSVAKVAHTVHIRHRDEVEPPITDWLREAYVFAGQRRAIPTRKRPARRRVKRRASA